MFTRIVFDTAPTVSDDSLVYEAAFLSILSAIFIKLPIGSYTSASFVARLYGCIYWQNDEGMNLTIRLIFCSSCEKQELFFLLKN